MKFTQKIWHYPNCGVFWYLYYTKDQREVDLRMAEFDDKKKLIEEVSKIKLEKKSIKDIFDKELYEEVSLYI